LPPFGGMNAQRLCCLTLRSFPFVFLQVSLPQPDAQRRDLDQFVVRDELDR
jgi:hypothetical protein